MQIRHSSSRSLLEFPMHPSRQIMYWLTSGCGLNILAWVGMYGLFILFPYYTFGIYHYEYDDLLFQTAPPYPLPPKPFDLLIYVIPSIMRAFLPLYVFGCSVGLCSLWHRMSWMSRVGWSVIIVIGLLVTTVAWSPSGRLIEFWIENND